MIDFKYRALVTGSTGFVGNNLMEYFQKKEISALGVSRIPKNDNTVDWDTFFASKSSFESYIHLAGKAHDLSDSSVSSEYAKVNTELTKKVFDVFLADQAAKTFIYFSSVKAVASKVDGLLMENHESQVENPYGQSKRESEKFLLAQELPEGKKLIILRPCMIHGPGNKGNLNLLFKFVKAGIPYPLGAFENQRSFLSIDNLLFAVNYIIQNELFPPGVYNIADDEPLSTMELIETLGIAIGKKPMKLALPKGLVQKMAKFGDTFKLPLNSHRLDKLTESYLVSNTKIKEALGIELFPTSSREGIIKTVQSF